MSQLPVTPDAPARAPLRRPAQGRMIAGVAGALGAHLGLSVGLIRLAFVIAALFSGLGIVAYGALWVLIPRESGRAPDAPGLEAASRKGMRPARASIIKPDDGVLISGGLIVVGLLRLFVSGGTVPSGLFWPAVIGGAGVIVIWLQADEGSESGQAAKGSLWHRLTRGGGMMSIIRLVGGLVLVVAGISLILATQVGIAQLPGVLGASAVLIAGLLVVAAPWLYQQRARVRRADADRLRAEARADMAAHLHDSVLQTLALIQRQADDPVTVAGLARRQERELRTWLYGETTRASSLRSALRELASDVEARFEVEVEMVCVGDAQVDDRLEALILAAGEAITNAAKHSGASRVDVFAEVEDGRVEVFVRDRGKGFDPSLVPQGHMGVRESITARMERYGGRATIRSELGSGTEVRLEIG
ncbi:hypothetical protein BW730_09895 [Tessaracoccus aquimaris]|uniref:Histidine kinase n=1 Tax=Tessaracoccus aquimaris TaxID=1332264 RepID=A0A1Q2CNR5_9ACTN|nr:PspC domain-containing protein [Tessaracoccus aquimaris]AQP47756.1 hypothetical protein BW730_09895 [Tessaracoccus aquimaris]